MAARDFQFCWTSASATRQCLMVIVIGGGRGLCFSSWVFAVLLVGGCSVSGGGASDVATAFERVDAQVPLSRPSVEVREHFKSQYIDIWFIGGEEADGNGTVYVLGENDGEAVDLDDLVSDVAWLFPGASDPVEAGDGGLWIECTDLDGGSGLTVGVHDGLGYIVDADRDIGSRVLDAVRS